MASWWQHILVAIAGTAAALPLRVQLDLGHGPCFPSSTGLRLLRVVMEMAAGTATVAAMVTVAATGINDVATKAATVQKGTAAAKAAMAVPAVADPRAAGPVPEVVRPEGVPAPAAATAMAGARETRMMAA